MKKITRPLIMLSLAIICLSQCKKDATMVCDGKTIKVISVDTALSLDFSNSRRSIVLSNENDYQVVQITTSKGYVDAGNGRKGAVINLPMEKGSMSTIYLVLDSAFLGESTTLSIAACNQPIQFVFPVISSRCDSLKKMNTIESSIQQKILGADSSEIIADGISKTYIELKSTKLDEEVTLSTTAGFIEVDNKTGQTVTTVLKAGNITRIFINGSTIPDNKVNLSMNRCFDTKLLYTLKYKQPITSPTMPRAGLQWTSSANSYWRRWERKAGYHALKKCKSRPYSIAIFCVPTTLLPS
jgi:hypothetical protein